MKQSGCDGSVQATATAKSHRTSARGGSLQASLKSRHRPDPTPQEIKERLQMWQIESICRVWLPDGKRRGNWWMARCPWRDDRKPSLGVSMTTGNWRDFATSEGGDVIDLSMRLFGDSFTQTVREFAELLGMR